jgi:hypothetical protein
LHTADPGAANLAPRHLTDHPAAIGDPIQAGVMKHDQLTVRGRPDVGLQVSVALLERAAEGHQGVFQAGQVADMPTAMSERARRAAVQIARHRRILTRVVCRSGEDRRARPIVSNRSSLTDRPSPIVTCRRPRPAVRGEEEQAGEDVPGSGRYVVTVTTRP